MTDPFTLRVRRRELLHFLDEGPEDSRGHHTAVGHIFGEDLAVALALRFLREWGGEAHGVSRTVTQGTCKGTRLDAWLRHDAPTGPVLYQTEIKMFAAHAIGGRALALDASEAQARAYREDRWQWVWSEEKGRFWEDGTQKVLTPTRPPEGHEHVRVEPLLCF